MDYIFMLFNDERSVRPVKSIMINLDLATGEIVGVCKYLLAIHFMVAKDTVCKVYVFDHGTDSFLLDYVFTNV